MVQGQRLAQKKKCGKKEKNDFFFEQVSYS
jgi:hypothetical protein